ncbi:MAG: hypothetical protein IPJ47_12250 [Anaerolineales bacterium]|nr:hypothetical protein [Anaerolineales bacterium]
MAPLEPCEKVLVDNETFSQTDHGELTRIECHAGVNASEKESTHEGLLPVPVRDRRSFAVNVTKKKRQRSG